VADPLLRLVCVPGVLDGAPVRWVGTMLQEDDIALLVDGGGLGRWLTTS
jgi:hypothetical protein